MWEMRLRRRMMMATALSMTSAGDPTISLKIESMLLEPGDGPLDARGEVIE